MRKEHTLLNLKSQGSTLFPYLNNKASEDVHKILETIN